MCAQTVVGCLRRKWQQADAIEAVQGLKELLW